MSQHAEPAGRLYAFASAPGALLDLVPLPRGGRPRRRARPADRPGPPLRQPSQQPDRLPPGRRRVLPRKVHYLANASLFRNPLLGALPRARRRHPRAPAPGRPETGRIATPRPSPPPARRSKPGHVLAIYPEGTTHAESRVQRIKTGAARIALDYETGASGARRCRTRAPPLALVPVGLSFEIRKAFRGRVLVAFGEPVPLGPHVARAREEPVAAVQSLTDAIQTRDGGRGRPRRSDRRRRGRPRRRGSVPRRAGPPAPGRARASARGDRRLPALPGHRRGGRLLQGARPDRRGRDSGSGSSTTARCSPSGTCATRRWERGCAGTSLPTGCGRRPPRCSACRSFSTEPSSNALPISSRAGWPTPSPARRRTTRRSASSRASSPSRSAGDSRPGSSGRLAGHGLGARVRGLAARDRAPRLPLPPRPRPAPRADGLRRPRADPPPGRGAAPGRAPRDPDRARAREGGLSGDARCRAVRGPAEPTPVAAAG